MNNLIRIGTAFTCFKEKFSIPRQSGLAPHSTGVIKLLAPYSREEALRGLDTFSHIILTFSPHMSESCSLAVRPPRLGGNKKMGVFATRSPFRPNPICSSIVKLDKVDFAKGEVHFSNHDLLDQSPILDIKPFIPDWDNITNATNGWLIDHPLKNQINIEFHPDVIIESDLKILILELLRLGPGPSYKKEDRNYAFKLDHYDIHFSYLSDVEIMVTRVVNI